jgi:ubiquinone/menaquinone biosynthesis C-methylase UbiE/uncharacterized coiled-coil protein SlyX
VHRYLQACEIAGGKVVLDLACGEGYGAAMLAGKAHRVIGVDIAEEVIQHARRRYTNANLEFKAGSCASVPLPDSSIDLVVSFETIEHHDQHEQMMREIKRVLRPAGVLLISSPDKYHYSIEPGNRNPYHVKELYQSEFKALLGRYFKNTAYFGQRVVHGSGIFAESIATTTSSYRREDEVIAASAGMAMPAYWIAVASDDQLPRIASGVFEQRSYDAATVQAWQGIVAERERQIATLTQAAAERERQIATLTQVAVERERQIATLTRVAAERERRIATLTRVAAERERRIAALTQAVAEHNQKIEDFEHKIAEHNRRLGEILASSSWRITAPLRAVRAQMRVTRAAI